MEAPGQLPSLPPPLKSGPGKRTVDSSRAFQQIADAAGTDDVLFVFGQCSSPADTLTIIR